MWIISEQDAPVIERLLALHDQQLSEAPMHRVVEAEKQLRQFLARTGVVTAVSFALPCCLIDAFRCDASAAEPLRNASCSRPSSMVRR